MTRLHKWFIESWDEVIAYFLTFWCAFISHTLPTLETGDSVVLNFQLGRFFIVATVALALTFAQEFIFPDPPATAKMTRSEKKAAKKKHMVKRFLFAMAFGLGAPGLTNTIISYVVKLSGFGG